MPTDEDDGTDRRRSPATTPPRPAEGIDLTAGDNADATTDGGGDKATSRDLKDAAQPALVDF